jgi:hypothetical protein
MSFRVDLLKKLTPEMALEGMLANQNRYRPEPRLATTGIGSLASATSKDVVNNRKLRISINQRVMKSAKSAAKH